jgi:molybdopterin-binding protein
VAQSARNRFEGIVTRVEKDRISAVVEVRAGPHRLVSLMTAEAATELRLRVGLPVACVIKATNVVVEVARGASASV